MSEFTTLPPASQQTMAHLGNVIGIVTKTVILLAYGCILCDGSQQSLEYEEDLNFKNKLCHPEEFRSSTGSRLACLVQCSHTDGCNSVVYRSTSKTCYGLPDRLACSSFTSLSDARFYKRKCGEIVPLITGTYGILDSQITASSEFNVHYLAKYGRLDGSEAWAAKTDTSLNDYLQFNFVQLRVFTIIITQGYNDPAEYTTSYNVLASTDCHTFTHIQSFSGNTDVTSHHSNTFASPFVARCIRVNPTAWVVWPTLRVEVYGCSLLPTQCGKSFNICIPPVYAKTLEELFVRMAEHHIFRGEAGICGVRSCAQSVLLTSVRRHFISKTSTCI